MLEAWTVSHATPIVTSRGALDDGNCHLTMPAVKGHCTHDALPDTFNIDMFKSIKRNSTTTKHIYNKSANIIEGFNVASDTNDCQNFP